GGGARRVNRPPMSAWPPPPGVQEAPHRIDPVGGFPIRSGRSAELRTVPPSTAFLLPSVHPVHLGPESGRSVPAAGAPLPCRSHLEAVPRLLDLAAEDQDPDGGPAATPAAAATAPAPAAVTAPTPTAAAAGAAGPGAVPP